MFPVLLFKGVRWLFGKTIGSMSTEDAISLKCSKSLIMYHRRVLLYLEQVELWSKYRNCIKGEELARGRTRSGATE